MWIGRKEFDALVVRVSRAEQAVRDHKNMAAINSLAKEDSALNGLRLVPLTSVVYAIINYLGIQLTYNPPRSDTADISVSKRVKKPT